MLQSIWRWSSRYKKTLTWWSWMYTIWCKSWHISGKRHSSKTSGSVIFVYSRSPEEHMLALKTHSMYTFIKEIKYFFCPSIRGFACSLLILFYEINNLLLSMFGHNPSLFLQKEKTIVTVHSKKKRSPCQILLLQSHSCCVSDFKWCSNLNTCFKVKILYVWGESTLI